jgi:transposase-like protein
LFRENNAVSVSALAQQLDTPGRWRWPERPYLNNLIEQDHRFIKKRITASLGFRSADAAWRTIDGYEAMHAIRKGQIRWLAKGDAVGQRQLIHALFGIAA